MIFNLLATEPGTRTAITFLSEPIIIIASVVLVLGIVLTLLTKSITLRIDKTVNAITYKKSKTYKMTLMIGCLIMFIGLLLLIVGTSILVCNF